MPASNSTTQGAVVPPLRVLVATPCPSDLPRFDAARAWREIADALAPLAGRGSVVVEQLTPATENALKQRLAQAPWHVFLFLGHAQARASARYGTLAFEASDGRTRTMNADYLAGLLAQNVSLRLAVLQTCDPAASALGTAAAALAEHGLAAVLTTGCLAGQGEAIFVAKLCAGLLRRLPLESLLGELRTALNAAHCDGSSVQLMSANARAVLFEEAQRASEPVVPAAAPSAAASAAALEAKRELERKRAAGEFDVFLCHNSADKPAVKRIGLRLKERGVLPWLDEWELPPGQAWQPLLEQQIGHIRSAAVCVGAAGVGPWQEQEIYGFLRAFVDRKCPVIPVLLDDAPRTPTLPIFLQAMTWVDFRASDPDPMARLVWGITGKRPDW